MDTAAFDLELGRRIRGLMEEQNVTLLAAAERTAIPFSTLWRHLNRGGLTIPEVHALAEVLDTSVSDLTALAVA
jgi:predicted transcriptional regulator